MLFSSLFFLLFFLPVCLFCFFQTKKTDTRSLILLIFSLIFYAWGGIGYLLLLFVMAAVGWFTALKIGRIGQQSHGQAKKWLIASVVIFLGVLGFFKYTGFFVGSLGALFGQDWVFMHMALPMGISFYTFKLISYVVDVYRFDTPAEQSYLMVLLYTSLFHHSMSGPIVRYAEIREELRTYKITYETLFNGFFRFCMGLAKKSILANHCANLAATFLPVTGDISSIPVSGVWLGSICYMLQIYLDFSAYSDMALGLGQMMGLTYKENFDYPYIAGSVKGFWKRWHISLSSFFKDYVYIPLGGNRCSTKRMTLNLLAVWALTGLWHGASWNFVLWGLFYFVFISFENWRGRRGKAAMPAALGHIYTLLVVFFGWILFRFENMASLGRALKGLFGLNHNALTGAAISVSFKNNVFFLIFAVIACTPFFKYLGIFIKKRFRNSEAQVNLVMAGQFILMLLMMLLSIFCLVGNTYVPFLYNQF